MKKVIMVAVALFAVLFTVNLAQACDPGRITQTTCATGCQSVTMNACAFFAGVNRYDGRKVQRHTVKVAQRAPVQPRKITTVRNHPTDGFRAVRNLRFKGTITTRVLVKDIDNVIEQFTLVEAKGFSKTLDGSGWCFFGYTTNPKTKNKTYITLVTRKDHGRVTGWELGNAI